MASNLQLDPEYEYLRAKCYLTHDGYVAILHDGKKTLVHRMLLEAKTGQVIDHINGDKQDNRLENLRFCTTAQNSANRRKSKSSSSSQYKGVSYCKQTKSWKAALTWMGNRITLGRYTCEHEAAKSYNRAAVYYFGEFAFTNEVPYGQ